MNVGATARAGNCVLILRVTRAEREVCSGGTLSTEARFSELALRFGNS